MSLEKGFSWRYQDLNFVGYSLAGITTSIFFKNASVCFDVGQGLPFQNSAKRICITHGHLDHASGIPYLVAQKNMAGQEQSDLFLPAHLVDPIERILKIWQEVDEHRYTYQIHPASPGSLHEFDAQFVMKPFATKHRVVSQGYLIYQRKKRLKEKFRNASREEILQAKLDGENPNEELLEPLVAFTGDTQIEFMDSDKDVLRAKVLFVEATFWSKEKSVEHARKWGHLHWDELIKRKAELQNERVVLIHTSVRYSTEELRRILDEQLSPEERERFVLFPRPL